MKWLVFFIAAVFALALETELLASLLVLDGMGRLYPSLAAILVVFVALFAPRTVALWAAWTLGLLMDLALPQERGVLIGPHALGYVFGTYLVLQVRTMVFRRRALTLALLTMVCMMASGIVEVALLTVQSWYPHGAVGDFRPLIELFRRFGMAVYSGLFALPVGWLLLRTLPLWSFQIVTERRVNYR